MEEVLHEECPDVSVTLSHRLSREYREYERTSTAVIDAYVKPITSTYLDTLDHNLQEGDFRGGFLLTRSGGGAMTVASAKEQPVHLVLSGPAGGVIGAAALGKILGHENLITIDMGGTSLDASLIAGGQAKVETEQQFETLPVSIPTIDIHTIGAGGGSIAWVDEGGHLQVGPQSAGAVPGPVCYGKGGDKATFTDAALAVGYLDPENFLGGEIPLDPGADEGGDRRARRRAGHLGRRDRRRNPAHHEREDRRRGARDLDRARLPPEGLLDSRLRRRRRVRRGRGRARAGHPDDDHPARAGDVLRVRDADDRRHERLRADGDHAARGGERRHGERGVRASCASSGRRRSRRTACPRRAGCSCRRPRCATRGRSTRSTSRWPRNS